MKYVPPSQKKEKDETRKDALVNVEIIKRRPKRNMGFWREELKDDNLLSQPLVWSVGRGKVSVFSCSAE